MRPLSILRLRLWLHLPLCRYGSLPPRVFRRARRLPELNDVPLPARIRAAATTCYSNTLKVRPDWDRDGRRHADINRGRGFCALAPVG
jgi:hypothetical protein